MFLDPNNLGIATGLMLLPLIDRKVLYVEILMCSNRRSMADSSVRPAAIPRFLRSINIMVKIASRYSN